MDLVILLLGSNALLLVVLLVMTMYLPASRTNEHTKRVKHDLKRIKEQINGTENKTKGYP